MSVQFQIPDPIQNPQPQESPEIRFSITPSGYDGKLPALDLRDGGFGFDPPDGVKRKLTPENLIESGVSVECSLMAIDWENKENDELITEQIIREVYSEQLREIGIDPERLQTQHWKYLRKISYPIIPLNSLEKDALDGLIKDLLDRIETIGVAVVITWLVLKWNGKNKIQNYTFKSNGGDIVLGTANYSFNIVLTAKNPVSISSEILRDRNVGVDILTDKPKADVLRRPILILKIGNKLIPIPETLGYQIEGDTQHIIPHRRRQCFVSSLMSLFGIAGQNQTSTYPYLKNTKPQPLEKSPEIIKLRIHYGNDAEPRLFSSPDCLLVADVVPYMLFSGVRVNIPVSISNRVKEYISYEKEKLVNLEEDKILVSELGAIFLENIKHSENGWPSWLDKKLQLKSTKKKRNKKLQSKSTKKKRNKKRRKPR